MANIFRAGFEMGDLLELTAGGVLTTGITGMSGTYCVYVNNSLSNTYITFANNAEIYIRARIRKNSASSYTQLSWGSTTTVLGSIRIPDSEPLSVYIPTTLVATGNTNLASDTTYLVEARIVIGNSGSITVKVDGVTEISYTGDTQPAAVTTVNRISFGSSGSTSWFDDLGINDVNGGVDNSWLGDGRIIALTPDGNGDSSQLVGSDGNSTDNYLLVDETPSNSDTDYCESAVDGNYDLYNLSASGLTGVTIKRVWAMARARDTVAAGGLCQLGIKSGTTEDWSPDLSLLTTYTTNLVGDIHTVNPDTGIAWTVSDLDALQAGFKAR